MNRIVVKSFRLWRRRNLRPGEKPTVDHAFAFFLGLAGEDEALPRDSWPIVCDALRQAGEVPEATHCIGPPGIYLGPRGLGVSPRRPSGPKGA